MRARRWGACPSVSSLTHEARRLGSTVARLKLKGIDGGPHKRWSMWFNSMQRAEPYLALTSTESFRDRGEPSGTVRQVLHGCRQLVSCDVGLSPATSATLAASYVVCLAGLPVASRRKAGMMSSQHGPYVLGYTHATMARTMGSQTARWSESSRNLASVQIVGCNSPA